MLFLLLLATSIAQSSGLVMYERAANLLEDRYLRLDDFDPAEGFRQAAEEAEASIPWLIVETDGVRATLTHGATGALRAIHMVAPDTSPGVRELPEALERLEKAILSMDEPIPEDVDLPVVLLRGLCRALDRHSVVLHKTKLERFDQRIKGKLTGIGSRLEIQDGELTAVQVFHDGPAEAGGLLAGDVILRIDGVSALGMSMSQSVERIRGPKGTEVRLLIRRRLDTGEDQERELVFTRDTVDIPNVSWSMDDDGVGIIKIDHFSEHTSRLTRAAIASFLEARASGRPYRGIVLDLRGNSGGSMIQASETTDLFVDRGVIVETAGRDGEPVPNLLQKLSAHPADDGLAAMDVPLVVLQNRRSASASEIVAGALKILDRATIIGRQSFGKGTVQKLYTLRGGKNRVRLKLTVAEYKLDQGRPVHGEGIDPDLVLRRVVFNRSGAWIPPDPDVGVPIIIDAEERKGWRTEGAADLELDPLMDLGKRLVLSAEGPSRTDVLGALETLAPILASAAEKRVMDTFRHRDLDWTPSDDGMGIVDADVIVSLLGDARAGERVELQAEIVNNGPAPLYRARVRLDAASARLPWDNVTIPLGFVPPGERALGTIQVAIPMQSPGRIDAVQMQLEADGLDPVALDEVMLGFDGLEAPPMAALVTLSPHGDHHRVEVVLENLGQVTLTGIRVRFAWRDDSGVELLDREALLPALGPEDRARVDLALRVLDEDSAEDIPLELRVDAERFQGLIRVPVTIPRDGSTLRVQPPQLDVVAPVRTDSDEVTVRFTAEDDESIESVTVWWRGGKHAWMRGDGRRLSEDLHLPVEPGSNRLTIVAKDDDGNETRAYRYIWSDQPPADAAVDGTSSTVEDAVTE